MISFIAYVFIGTIIGLLYYYHNVIENMYSTDRVGVSVVAAILWPLSIVVALGHFVATSYIIPILYNQSK